MKELAEPNGIDHTRAHILDAPSRPHAQGQGSAVHLERLQEGAPRRAHHREGDGHGGEEAGRLLVHEHPDHVEPGDAARTRGSTPGSSCGSWGIRSGRTGARSRTLRELQAARRAVDPLRVEGRHHLTGGGSRGGRAGSGCRLARPDTGRAIPAATQSRDGVFVMVVTLPSSAGRASRAKISWRVGPFRHSDRTPRPSPLGSTTGSAGEAGTASSRGRADSARAPSRTSRPPRSGGRPGRARRVSCSWRSASLRMTSLFGLLVHLPPHAPGARTIAALDEHVAPPWS